MFRLHRREEAAVKAWGPENRRAKVELKARWPQEAKNELPDAPGEVPQESPQRLQRGPLEAPKGALGRPRAAQSDQESQKVYFGTTSEA